MFFLFVILTFIFTVLGGLFAIRFSDKLHLILGFSAGAVIGVSLFDLIPESIEILKDNISISSVLTITALGFVIFMLIDRFLFTHCHNQENHDFSHHKSLIRGKFGASSLSIHSFLDGIAIGLSFQVSTMIGTVVTLAVLAHDFSDGINTIGLILKNGGNKISAMKWLMIDALAPVLGALLTLFIHVGEITLGYILAGFAGFFLYLGASDLLPESHHDHPKIWTTFLTVIGMAFIYIIVNLV
jgi:ZIP family zinc transporter